MNNPAWHIGIYTGPTPFQLSSPAGITNPVLEAKDITDLNVDTLAHPFLIPTDSTYWLFFTAKHGEDPVYSGIGLAESRDGLSWKYRQIVLKEPHVLSYPHIIHHQGQYYMIPESYEETFVRLYRATQFPYKWTPVHDLLTGDHFVSPSVVHYNNRWWMFAGCLDNATLRLFHADDLKGPWKEHPKSPIIKDDLHTARPAGRPLIIDGVLYRLGQDCLPTYGRQVLAFQVTDITPTTYRETKIETPLISATGQGWNAKSMHHVDAHQISESRWIAAIDANGSPRA